MATQTREIKVRGVISGDRDIKKMADSLGSISKEAKKAGDAFSSLRNITSGVVGGSILGFGIRELAGMADGMTQLSSRLSIFVGEGERAKTALESIIQIANETKAPISGIATVFSRIAIATDRLNLSLDLQLALTKTLQNSFRLSGAKAEEATSATIQFTQALSFGALRGQELRSVLSSNAPVANILAKSIEGTGKSLFQFAEAGGFTSKFVLKALIKDMDDVNTKADTMSQTFEQSLNVAMNSFTVTVGDLNKTLGLSDGFAAFINFVIEKGPGFDYIISLLAITTLPLLTKSIWALNASMLVNPIVLFLGAIAGLTAAATYAAGGFNQFVAEVKTLPATLSLIVLQITSVALNILSLGTLLSINNPVGNFFKKTTKDLTKFIQDTRSSAKALDEAGKSILKPFDSNKLNKELDNMSDGLKALTIDQRIGALNTAFNSGRVSIQDYISGINKLEVLDLNERLLKGTISLSKFNEEMGKVKIDDLSRKLDVGAISIGEFDAAINNFKIDQLNQKFNEGKITVTEFTRKLRELKIEGMDQNSVYTGMIKGLNDFTNSVGTTADVIAGGVKNTFDSLADSLFKATKSGKLDFAEMTQSILDDITKIAIRLAIVKPLAEGLLGGIFGPSTSGTATAAGSSQFNNFTGPSVGQANGGVWSGGVQKFASGGIVNSPTMFGIAGGRTGLMGEAGPEAIVPLKRGSNGSLGVQSSPTVINIINNASADVQTQERTTAGGSKTIDVIIKAKVREGLASGEYDRQMQQSYGLQRKGV